MLVAIHAVGKMKRGPEQELAERYLDRFAKAGPALGLAFGGLAERSESRASTPQERKADEAASLAAELGRCSAPALLVLLDERGKAMSSEEFAGFIAERRDSGTRAMLFALGGPDGHDPAMSARADRMLAFGPATWPHQLARIMLAEQLYRAVTILAGHPYHRA